MYIYKDTITNRNKEFEKILLKNQKQLKEYCKNRLQKKTISGDGYVFRQGTYPVLLVAHLDRYHETVKKGKDGITEMVYANGSLSSPQGICGDDRCGVYMIFQILKDFDCSVAFLEDEEIGCIGAKKIASSGILKQLKNKVKFIVEFDRKGSRDAVTYDCENDKFDNFLESTGFFKKAYGTCSDISYIAPKLEVAAVNFSCGYYNEHHLKEHIMLDEMYTVIEESKKIIAKAKDLSKPFEYIERKRSTYYNYNSYYNGSYYNSNNYIVSYKDTDGTYKCTTVYGYTESAAMYKFFKDHPDVSYNMIDDICSENDLY